MHQEWRLKPSISAAKNFPVPIPRLDRKLLDRKISGAAGTAVFIWTLGARPRCAQAFGILMDDKLVWSERTEWKRGRGDDERSPSRLSEASRPNGSWNDKYPRAEAARPADRDRAGCGSRGNPPRRQVTDDQRGRGSNGTPPAIRSLGRPPPHPARSFPAVAQSLTKSAEPSGRMYRILC